MLKLIFKIIVLVLIYIVSMLIIGCFMLWLKKILCKILDSFKLK